MSAQQDALFAFWIPLDNKVCQRHRLARKRMFASESLPCDVSAQILEMLFEQFLLLLHPGTAAHAIAERTELAEIIVGPLAIESRSSLWILGSRILATRPKNAD